MKFSSFISYVNNPADAESSFQFIIPPPQKYTPGVGDDFFYIEAITLPNGEVVFPPKDLEKELENFFFKSLFEQDALPSYCEGMLEFHFQKYPGVKSDFLSFITYSIKNKEMHARGTFRDRPYFTTLHRQLLKQTVIEWVDKKKQELENGEIKTGSHKRNDKHTKLLINHLRCDRTITDTQKQILIDSLKTEFNGRLGKEMAFMILCLEDYKILNRNDWSMRSLHRSLGIEFENIATFQAINDDWMNRKFLNKEEYKSGYEGVRRRVKACLDASKILP